MIASRPLLDMSIQKVSLNSNLDAIIPDDISSMVQDLSLKRIIDVLLRANRLFLPGPLITSEK